MSTIDVYVTFKKRFGGHTELQDVTELFRVRRYNVQQSGALLLDVDDDHHTVIAPGKWSQLDVHGKAQLNI